MRYFKELLSKLADDGKFVCVGLDSDFQKIPLCIWGGSPIPSPEEVASDPNAAMLVAQAVLLFNQMIVDATGDLVCAFKLNSSFYEQLGPEGWLVMRSTAEHIHTMFPDVIVIWDCKRGDIDNSNLGYVRAMDYLRADALTVHNYLGSQAMKPFLDRTDKGIFVLCRTSNKGAEEIQGLPIHTGVGAVPLYVGMAEIIRDEWNGYGNVGVVAPATYPDELHMVRRTVGDMPILIPGYGAQGGELEAAIAAGKNSLGRGMIVNSSRGIIFASKGENFAEAARMATIQMDAKIRTCLGLAGPIAGGVE